MSQIFISYSHQDEKWKDRLERHLKVFELEKKLELQDLHLLTQENQRIDSHPIVREYYHHSLKTKDPELFQKSQEILYEHYQKLPLD